MPVGSPALLFACVFIMIRVTWAKMIRTFPTLGAGFHTLDGSHCRCSRLQPLYSDTYYSRCNQAWMAEPGSLRSLYSRKLHLNHTGSRLPSTDLSAEPHQPATAHKNKVPLTATYVLEGLDLDFRWRSKPTHQIAHSEHTHFGCPQHLKLRISKTGLHIPTSFPRMNLLLQSM